MRVTRSTGPSLNLSLVHTGAGYFENDRTCVDLELGAGASVCISSPAASIAFPCRGQGWSSTEVRASVGPGAFLAWLPEPLISAQNSSHRGRTVLNLEEGASAIWREEILAGRTGETGGRLELAFSAELGGQPLFRDAVVFGPNGWIGPRTLVGRRFTGTLASLGRRLPDGPGVMQLAACGSIVRAVADNALEVRHKLDQHLDLPEALLGVGRGPAVCLASATGCTVRT